MSKKFKNLKGKKKKGGNKVLPKNSGGCQQRGKKGQGRKKNVKTKKKTVTGSW